MTSLIGRRLDRLETEVQKSAGGWRPGGPTFQLIDDPRDPENAKEMERGRTIQAR